MQKFNINLVKSFLSFIKESKTSYFFEWQKSKHAKGGQSSKTISFFVKKRNKAKARFQRKTTPFRIRNSLVKTFLQYSESPSLRGFAEAIYINWIASLSFAHSVRLMAMTIKNNFANINLVKTFLTYLINFDTYRGKRRNLVCINKKFFHQGVIK